jgi:L-iditol 2-dehydrogenase
MRALVISQPNAIGMRQIEPQPMGSDDVIVRSSAIGICGTDLEILNGLISPKYVRYPVVIGHEWSGVVVDTGDNVKHIRPGDRVIVEGLVVCGRCESCRNGATNLCEHYDQLGFTRYGGGAEYVVAPGRNVHLIPDHVSHEAAVLVEPSATVLRGILRTPMQPGWTAAVVGPGTLGMLAIQFLKAFGASQILLVGVNDEQLEFGLRLGATSAVNSTKYDAVQRVRELTDGRGVDVAIETSGSADAVKTCLEACRYGGHAVLKGVAGEGKQLTLPSDFIMLRDITVHGIFSYTTQSWAAVLKLLAAGLIQFEPLITHRYPIDDFALAFHHLTYKQGVIVKIVMTHGSAKEGEATT